MAALLHDVRDWKYSGQEHAGVEAARAILSTHSYPHTDQVCTIITDISFKNELARSPTMPPMSMESMIVQDADRLDAIGAIGIARTFAYGSTKQSPFYNRESFKLTTDSTLSKDEYMKKSGQQAPTVDHFYDKLLKLSGMMKTQSGRQLAEKRHQFMVMFLEQMSNEIEKA
eukprot:gene12626-14823_t